MPVCKELVVQPSDDVLVCFGRFAHSHLAAKVARDSADQTPDAEVYGMWLLAAFVMGRPESPEWYDEDQVAQGSTDDRQRARVSRSTTVIARRGCLLVLVVAADPGDRDREV